VTDLGGHVLKKLGDGLMALFGSPQAQENDAERAVRAALAIQRALAELNARNANSGAPELLARIGLESGPVVVEPAGEVFGEAPNIAARVHAAAEPGSVLITLNVQNVNRTFRIAAGAIPAVRDRDVLPSQLRSRLNVADKSQCLGDLRHFRRGRKAFERPGENGMRVDGAAA
jgi:class 3 adenylate cyclase